MKLVPLITILTLASIRPAGAAGEAGVSLAPGGAIRVQAGADSWLITSRWSFPQKPIGWNRLEAERAGGEPSWSLKAGRENDGTLRAEAGGAYYRLVRRVRTAGHRTSVTDILTNTGPADIGILVEHTLASDRPLSDVRLCGGTAEAANFGENATIFARREHSALGLIAEDNVFRSQLMATRKNGLPAFGLQHLGLAPGKSVSLEWSIYPFARPADYFDLVNRIREDWGIRTTIDGPGDWIDVTRPEVRQMLGEPARLKAFLGRMRLKVILLVPWLDYDNINRITDRPTTRDEYRRFMTEAARQIKAVDPGIKTLGCIEGPFVSLPRDLVDRLVEAMPSPRKTGYFEMTPEMLAMFKASPEAWRRWGDSVVWGRGGKGLFEYYTRGANHQVQMVALTVRPILGNGQHAYLMEQARFITEEVGLDGFYVDSFTGAQHWHYGYSYDRWDGLTVDMDPATGQITDRYTDLALAGVGSRKALIEYGLSRGKLVVLNGHPIDRETQRLPAMYFNESEWVFEPLKWMDREPPLEQRPCEAHFSTPLALGFRPDRSGEEGTARYAEVIMKGVVAYLRHGITYFHYQTRIPETGPGSGEYGPINAMFPITPLRLGEGFIEGRERIVACVSRRFARGGAERPRVTVFDLNGRAVNQPVDIRRVDGSWEVDLRIADWRQIAVIEGMPAGDETRR